jgi:hypothetical protein
MNCRRIACEERDTAFPPLGLEIVRDVIGHWGLKLLTFACRIRIKSLAPHVGMFPSSQKILRLIPWRSNWTERSNISMVHL